MAIYRVEQWDEIGVYGKSITVPTLGDAVTHLRAAGDSIVAIEKGVERPLTKKEEELAYRLQKIKAGGHGWLARFGRE
jgi:hypothetical protein